MIEAAETVAAFIEGRSRADLDQDRMLLFALLRDRLHRRRAEPERERPSRVLGRAITADCEAGE